MTYTLGLSLLFFATLIIILWDNGLIKRVLNRLFTNKSTKIDSPQASEFDTIMSNKELCYVANQRASNHGDKVDEEEVKKTGKIILSTSNYLKIEADAFNLFSEQVESNEC